MHLPANDRARSPLGGSLPPPPIEVLRQRLKRPNLQIQWLAGDGSDRAYYRLIDSDPFAVVMQLSGSDKDILAQGRYDWIEIGKTLERHHVRVPRLLDVLGEYGALIIEDCGDRMLETEVVRLCAENARPEIESLYLKATDIIAKLFAIVDERRTESWSRRAFDQARLVWELRFFIAEYLEPVAGWQGSRDQLNVEIDDLAGALAAQPQVFVHRDFHSRNIMVDRSDPSQLVVIDFQDARLGPPAYDLVSLCFDSYVPIPNQERLPLLDRALSKMSMDAAVRQSIEETWRPVLVHRQLKAIGSFGYLTLKKNRGDYLRYVPTAARILVDAGVADSRWPLLSRTIPALLSEGLTR